MRNVLFTTLFFAATTLIAACHDDAKENAINSAESDRDFPDMADSVISVDTIGITADTSL